MLEHFYNLFPPTFPTRVFTQDSEVSDYTHPWEEDGTRSAVSLCCLGETISLQTKLSTCPLLMSVLAQAGNSPKE